MISPHATLNFCNRVQNSIIICIFFIYQVLHHLYQVSPLLWLLALAPVNHELASDPSLRFLVVVHGRETDANILETQLNESK